NRITRRSGLPTACADRTVWTLSTRPPKMSPKTTSEPHFTSGRRREMASAIVCASATARAYWRSSDMKPSRTAVVPDWTRVEFGHAVLSRRQVKILSELVAQRIDWLKARGIRPQAWGPRSDMSGVGWHGGPFELVYDGDGELDDESRAPFLLYGP